MLGSVSKLFDKNFVIGFYLPALAAVVAIAWAFPDFALLSPVRSLTASEKTLGDLTYVALVAWVFAILLMASNHAQYRLLEGYLPPVAWLRPLLCWHRFRFRRLKGELDMLKTKWQEAVNQGEDFPQQKQDRVTYLSAWLSVHYPSKEGDVMPTRFGNTIRSFEVYPRDVYGVDGVSVWLRLASVIPKDYASLVEDARAEVDFFVNTSNLAILFVILSLAGAVHDARWQYRPILGPVGLCYLHVAAIGVVIAAVAYYSAAARAMAWGDLVRSAFDCYLLSLIKQLGFAVPSNEKERHEFWTQFSRLIVYKQPMTPDRWPLASESALKQEKALPERTQEKAESPSLEEKNELTEPQKNAELSKLPPSTPTQERGGATVAIISQNSESSAESPTDCPRSSQ